MDVLHISVFFFLNIQMLLFEAQRKKVKVIFFFGRFRHILS